MPPAAERPRRTSSSRRSRRRAAPAEQTLGKRRGWLPAGGVSWQERRGARRGGDSQRLAEPVADGFSAGGTSHLTATAVAECCWVPHAPRDLLESRELVTIPASLERDTSHHRSSCHPRIQVASYSNPEALLPDGARCFHPLKPRELRGERHVCDLGPGIATSHSAQQGRRHYTKREAFVRQ